ncbi:MAG: PIG-L deacetylase family protein [Patescibacteria group bacterium]
MQKLTSLKKLGVSANSKILLVFPHPDDEAVFTGGLIQFSLKARADLKLIVLTKGESSTLRHGLKETQDLAIEREKELKKACTLLGLKNCTQCSYADGSLGSTQHEVTEFLYEQIKSYNPDFVVTYEPQGVYGHVDHVLTSKIITSLKHELNFKILYATIHLDSEVTKEVFPLEPNIMLELSSLDLVKKLFAVLSHKSQFRVHKLDSWKWIKLAISKKEYFHLMY